MTAPTDLVEAVTRFRADRQAAGLTGPIVIVIDPDTADALGHPTEVADAEVRVAQHAPRGKALLMPADPLEALEAPELRIR